MAYRHIPVSGGKYDDASIRAMGEALDATEGKALIFCRTGMRSTTLWALAQADRKPVAHLLGAADAAGYDLTQIGSASCRERVSQTGRARGSPEHEKKKTHLA